ncbi:hypothetical protein SARC_10152 [Sphaeroforma arctica JP610]|uniref:Uncharacterized protein n=1 Tax=Sphaeroforma arctica JP610 TaxID=667725 RepID=A0A0L0FKT2_9EUKA|nr:hypothetical protein SARC_10152 [Sphaeroforma arctica JP610]KNC77385.1 hypothetical protein SARC_10152 [Sphaeroforma arctica JP610]|eukprot:XP_014151287.1 hypothetical protein SARC_10152 [Sphaeroforma arctica JP610]
MMKKHDILHTLHPHTTLTIPNSLLDTTILFESFGSGLPEQYDTYLDQTLSHFIDSVTIGRISTAPPVKYPLTVYTSAPTPAAVDAEVLTTKALNAQCQALSPAKLPPRQRIHYGGLAALKQPLFANALIDSGTDISIVNYADHFTDIQSGTYLFEFAGGTMGSTISGLSPDLVFPNAKSEFLKPKDLLSVLLRCSGAQPSRATVEPRTIVRAEAGAPGPGALGSGPVPLGLGVFDLMDGWAAVRLGG